jgi:hypothetical protein
MAIKVPFSIVLNWLSSNGWQYISGHFKNTESFLQVACVLCGKIRSFCFANSRCPCLGLSFSTFQIEVLTGILLGDAHLERRNLTYNTNLTVSHYRKDKKYVEHLGNIFNEFLTKRGIADREVFDKRTQKKYYSTGFKTRNMLILNEFHTTWYKNKIKIIPKDLCLTSTIMAYWIADDGHVSYGGKYHNKIKKISYSSLYFKLSTQAFTKKENLFLVSLLCERYGEGFSVGKYNVIYCTRSDTAKRVFRDIDKIFPLSRKAIWREPRVEINIIKKIYPCCPYCKNEKVYKNGHNSSHKQKFYCLECKKQYIKGEIECLIV